MSKITWAHISLGLEYLMGFIVILVLFGALIVCILYFFDLGKPQYKQTIGQKTMGVKLGAYGEWYAQITPREDGYFDVILSCDLLIKDPTVMRYVDPTWQKLVPWRERTLRAAKKRAKKELIKKKAVEEKQIKRLTTPSIIITLEGLK